MKTSHEEPAADERSDEPRMIPYKGHPDWRMWVDENYTKFSDGRIKASDPSFYSFLIRHKLLHEAKGYLREEWNIRVPGSKISREEFIRKINEVRAEKGWPPELRVIDREEEQKTRREDLERMLGEDD